jgi:hypothetical protein
VVLEENNSSLTITARPSERIVYKKRKGKRKKNTKNAFI